MNRPQSKIFLDGGVPEETREAARLFQQAFGAPIDGQTTNPTLIAKNLASNQSALTEDQALLEYKRIVQEMSAILPHGSISIQVFANQDTTAEEMVVQARERMKWIPNHSIKLPCTYEGLKAAGIICKESPINITLVFSQSQAAAVYEATKEARYPVFLSPFVGRLDDRGENGMELIEDIVTMYTAGDGHVEVLTASTRSLNHVLYALKLSSHIITIPFKVFHEWAGKGFPQPDDAYRYVPGNLTPIPYNREIVLGKPWNAYDLYHPLTEKGITAFWNDWNGLFNQPPQ